MRLKDKGFLTTLIWMVLMYALGFTKQMWIVALLLPVTVYLMVLIWQARKVAPHG